MELATHVMSRVGGRLRNSNSHRHGAQQLQELQNSLLLLSLLNITFDTPNMLSRRGALFLGALLVSVTGFLGGAIVYGLDHYNW